ncbi:hypothetical protein ILUMI_22720 [Ignelater luminosus]|uniref:Uncharacterized protein n=1 Tax=Ignelater luminosus TaxID=2038154 RepID=A0A8K0G2M1_IGNLU|nr:hypothetical protein ILUMI_22720 [Ignelater luminosus]
MPSHCSHRLQLLNVAVYGPLKAHYNTSVDQWMKDHPGTPMSIYDISGCCGVAFERAMTSINILARLKRTGIAPLDRHVFTDTDFLPSSVPKHYCKNKKENTPQKKEENKSKKIKKPKSSEESQPEMSDQKSSGGEFCPSSSPPAMDLVLNKDPKRLCPCEICGQKVGCRPVLLEDESMVLKADIAMILPEPVVTANTKRQGRFVTFEINFDKNVL